MHLPSHIHPFFTNLDPTFATTKSYQLQKPIDQHGGVSSGVTLMDEGLFGRDHDTGYDPASINDDPMSTVNEQTRSANAHTGSPDRHRVPMKKG